VAEPASAPGEGLSRRGFLRLGSAAMLALPLSAALGGVAAGAPWPPLQGVEVAPRAAWAAGLPVPGPLPEEAAGDVRFLLVHHSASPNDYGPDEVHRVLQGFHAFHTGPDKGWPDVAYNFFVDRYGRVWEGRQGSVAGPVLPDATGGSQGFAQICCFVGDHTSEPPTAEAQRAMTALLAALAERYGIDATPGATATFVSRGSNKWAAGAEVTTTTIAGHRDMSLTTCPGDAAYPLVRDAFPAEVAAILAARATPPPAAAPTETSSPVPHTAEASTSPADGGQAAGSGEGMEATTVALVAAGGAVVGGAALGLLWHARSSAETKGAPTGDQASRDDPEPSGGHPGE
jgi:hypothetical protein